MRRLAFVILVSSLLLTLTSVQKGNIPVVKCREPLKWVQYVPDASQVELDYWEENGMSYMNVSVVFPSSGYNVSDWGCMHGCMFVNAEIWDLTEADLPVITTRSHTYSLGNLSAGIHSFTFKVWDSMIKKTAFIVTPSDTTSPTISIVSPENKTYTANDVPLTFTVSESTSWIGFSLDDEQNQTITGNWTLPSLSDGLHNLIVYATDTAGNTGASEAVYFTVETPEPEPFPMWIVGVMVIIVVFGATLLVYFTRSEKTTEKEM